MSSSSGAPAAFLLLLLLPYAASSQTLKKPLIEQSPASADGTGLKLRLQDTLLPAAAPGEEQDLPIFFEGDRLQGHQGKDLEAEGNVVLRRRGQALFADQLIYSIPTNEVTATGHVRFERLGDVVTGERAQYNLDTEAGSIDAPSYQFRQIKARGKAQRLIIKDRNRYRAERATYTNCDVGHDDWYLRVSRMDLDRTKDVGVARNTTVFFKGVPIFYTPWINFPLSSKRKTGFLPPLIGNTSNSGFEITQPFYWNIAPNRDYTIAPRLLTRRGVLLNNEFRYLDRNYAGELRVEYLPDDRIKGESRYGLSLQHAHNFGRGFTGWLDLQKVSDDTYFVDLSDKIAATSQTNLPQEAGVRYNGSWWDVMARTQRFQTLQDPLAPLTPPYARMPQIKLNASQQNIKGFDLAFLSEFVSFEHPTMLNGKRQVYYPYVTYPVQTPLFHVTPKLGYHFTHYSFPDDQNPSETRALPIFSVDSGMSFERDAKIGGRRLLQTLEPRLYYVYIPFRNQDQLPLFDTSIADFNLTQIFTENQFSGYDRINDANQITAAATTRLINPATGAEILRATLGQRFYFEEQRVTLNNQVRSSTRSDLLAALSGAISRTWSSDFGTQYDADNGFLRRFNIGVRHQPEPGKILNLAYRYNRDLVDQVDISAQWPLTRRWTGLMRWNYSLSDNTTLEALAGLEYNASCWTARFVTHRFVTSTQEKSSAIFFQLELTGLSRIGNSPLSLLQRSIVGYGGRSASTSVGDAGRDYPASEFRR